MRVRLNSYWSKNEYPALSGGRLDIAAAKRFPDIIEPVGLFQGQIRRPTIFRFRHFNVNIGDVFTFVHKFSSTSLLRLYSVTMTGR